MSVDKFGRYESRGGGGGLRGPPGEGFDQTADGDYNIAERRLRNVGRPTEGNDAVTLSYLLDNVPVFGGGGGGELNVRGNRITQVGRTEEEDDAVTMRFLNKRIPRLFDDRWLMDQKRLAECEDPAEVLDAVNFRTMLVAMHNMFVMLGGERSMPFVDCLDRIVPTEENIKLNEDIHLLVKERAAASGVINFRDTPEERKGRCPQVHEGRNESEPFRLPLLVRPPPADDSSRTIVAAGGDTVLRMAPDADDKIEEEILDAAAAAAAAFTTVSKRPLSSEGGGGGETKRKRARR